MFNDLWSTNMSRVSPREKREMFGPGQTINVWQPNTIEHCLVTKHANVQVSGQTVKICLIKHRSNNSFKPLSKRGTHALIKHV